MENLIDELIDVIGAEKALYETLLDLLKKERQSVLSMNGDAILGVTKEKETLLLRIRAMEESRDTVTSRIAEAAGNANEELDLRGIVRLASGDRRDELEALRTSLYVLARECGEMNAQNRFALSNGARVVQDAIAFFRKSLAGTPVYEKTRELRFQADAGKVVSQQA